MFIIIKYSMTKQINTLIGGPPRFLTTKFDILARDATEKAVAHYIRERNLTPKLFAKGEFKIKWLHYYLCKYDSRWNDIPPQEMKTTPPRTLVHAMNTHVNRWKLEYKAVQKVIDGLPEVKDTTEELDPANKQSITRSENSVDEAEEAKGQSLDDEVAVLSVTPGQASKKSYAGMADQ